MPVAKKARGSKHRKMWRRPGECHSEEKLYLIHHEFGRVVEVTAPTPGLALNIAALLAEHPIDPVIGVEEEDGTFLKLSGRCANPHCQMWLLPFEHPVVHPRVGLVCGECRVC